MVSLAGFIPGMLVKMRMKSDCIVITAQNTRELWGCAEGLNVTHFNKKKMNQWIKEFPGRLTIPALSRSLNVIVTFV
jgi:toxic protein SymE